MSGVRNSKKIITCKIFITCSISRVVMLKKKHNAIAYHQTREAVAAGTIRVTKEDGKTNLADVLTKPLPQATKELLCDKFMSWRVVCGVWRRQHRFIGCYVALVTSWTCIDMWLYHTRRFRNISFFWVLLLQGLYVRKISTFHGSPLNNAFFASRSKLVLETNVQWTLSRLEDGLYLTRRLGISLSPIFFVLLT